MLDRMGVPRSAYDGIVTSGDVTREHGVRSAAASRSILIGPERDHTIFTGLDAPFSTPEDAAYVICTGLFDDEVETPDDYREHARAKLRARNLFMVCANPDIVVERGDKLIYCAGALADAYRRTRRRGLLRRRSRTARSTIWRSAEIAKARGAPASLSRVLAIGDSVRTDLKARTISASTACSSPPAFMPRNSGDRDDPDTARALAAIFDGGRPRPEGGDAAAEVVIRDARRTDALVSATEGLKRTSSTSFWSTPSPASCGPFSRFFSLRSCRSSLGLVDEALDVGRASSRRQSARRAARCAAGSRPLWRSRWPVMSWNEQASKMIIIFSSTSAL